MNFDDYDDIIQEVIDNNYSEPRLTTCKYDTEVTVELEGGTLDTEDLTGLIIEMLNKNVDFPKASKYTKEVIERSEFALKAYDELIKAQEAVAIRQKALTAALDDLRGAAFDARQEIDSKE